MLPSLPQDKANHAVYGTALYILLSYPFPLLALGAVIFIATAKELMYDKIMAKGTPDYMDFVATIILPACLWFKHYMGY